MQVMIIVCTALLILNLLTTLFLMTELSLIKDELREQKIKMEKQKLDIQSIWFHLGFQEGAAEDKEK